MTPTEPEREIYDFEKPINARNAYMILHRLTDELRTVSLRLRHSKPKPGLPSHDPSLEEMLRLAVKLMGRIEHESGRRMRWEAIGVDDIPIEPEDERISREVWAKTAAKHGMDPDRDPLFTHLLKIAKMLPAGEPQDGTDVR